MWPLAKAPYLSRYVAFGEGAVPVALCGCVDCCPTAGFLGRDGLPNHPRCRELTKAVLAKPPYLLLLERFLAELDEFLLLFGIIHAVCAFGPRGFCFVFAAERVERFAFPVEAFALLRACGAANA